MSEPAEVDLDELLDVLGETLSEYTRGSVQFSDKDGPHVSLIVRLPSGDKLECEIRLFPKKGGESK